MPKNTLRVPLDQPTLTQKKIKLKLAKQGKKEGSWLAVCVVNEICIDC